MNLKKRSQITVFMILAAIIILSVSIFVFLREKQVIFQPEIVTPFEIEPIKKYVETCAMGLAADAVEVIGLQGGYLNVPEEIISEKTSYIDFGYGIFAVPFWYFDGEMRIPPLDFIKTEIENYVSENLEECIKGFSPFSFKYDFKTEDEPEAELEFLEGSMLIHVDYPVRIKDKYANKAARLEEFSAVVPVDLKSAYDLANRTMWAQHNRYLIENLTIDIMASDPDTFPFTGMMFECDEQRWKVSGIRDSLQETMSKNLIRIRVRNTDYPPFEREEEFYESYREYDMEDIQEGRYPSIPVSEAVSDWYEYYHLFFDVGSESPDMRVSFMHEPEWGMELHVKPSSGDLMLPRDFPGSGFLNFVCFRLYHYVYSIRYPVLVRILDPGAFMGKGFTFQFAFPVIIMDNLPIHDSFRVADFTGFQTAYEFCDREESFGTAEYALRAIGLDEDGYPDQPISGANISYRCLSRLCENIGVTGHGGWLRTALPEGCGNPTIIARKDGYLDGYATLTGESVDIELAKTRHFNYTIVKRKFNSADKDDKPLEEKFSAEMGLGSDEHAALWIIPSGRKEEQAITYPRLEGSPESMWLLEEGGTYEVEAVLYRGNPDDNLVIGGYFRDNLTIRHSDFKNSKTIIIPLIEYEPNPADDSARAVMMEFLLNQSYNFTIAPRFS